ncbi:class II fructose-bisphosphate aldolase [Tetragenococcus koreensis]|nr:class II fructose-bisphosphate aldolase [Tetragenococcus koreensis]MCF1585156.1 class II fructose-bisphosphate aldolase [Tetragenococcus koreensis]MCF1624568.1 class II fructose-bisphosphate aldolase [Tetragenococcus koreensis]MCF1629477.1 class II fructose-bisphosphate aldolase [Tetragenococcus koreensis]MCF1642397.1 class II fructose-bisphosphate aldolase [Tetragenococcus koreensis]MDN6733398.1 class II fructose-bisphosphate aldolase [Tetragenococcus koreensis]
MQAHGKLLKLSDIVPVMLHYVEKAKVPVAVHLDHSSSFDVCVHAIREWVTSIMYDASDKDFKTNLVETKEIVRIAYEADVSVEVELGHIFTSEFSG